MLDELPLEDQYVFTSLRYDVSMKRNSQNPVCSPEAKIAYLMKYHHDRLINAAEHLAWFHTLKVLKGPAYLFLRVQAAVEAHKKKSGNKCPFKVRICLRHSGKLEIGVEPVMSLKQPLLFPATFDMKRQNHEAAPRKPIYKVVLDVLPTRCSQWTRNKTHYRTMYNYARQCAGIQSFQDAKEVLLFNKESQIMDASITTPYFFRNGQWVTPHSDCGGQQGTTRRWALDQGLCIAGNIDVSSLRHDEIIWLSNGVKGFFTARFVASNGLSRAPSYESRTNSGLTSCSSSDVQTEEDSDDALEISRRKYPVAPDGEAFRNEAFILDIFERTLKL